MANCGSLSAPGKSRSTTWKIYSTANCDQTMTDKMFRFALFGSLHQGQPKVQSFVLSLSSPGKLRWRPGKIIPPSTVAKRWQVWWLDLRSLEACINGNLKFGHLWVIVITWKIKVNDLEKLLHPAQWLNSDSYADWICSVLKSAGDGRLWVTIIRWKIMVSDLEKLLHRAL